MTRLVWLLGSILFLSSVTVAHAGVIGMELSTTSDLSALTPGDVVVIDVSVTGVSALDPLEFIAATVTFDEQVFGTPDSVLPGSIVPDLTGFQSFGSLGMADASYDSLFALTFTPIVSDGVLFSFQLTAANAGVGSIDFSFGDAQLASDFPNPTSVNFGGPLDYQVTSRNVVPEPASCLTWLAMTGCCLSTVRRSRRRLTL